MAVAEIFLTVFITVLFEKLASAQLIKLARSEGIDVQLNKWKDTLSQIQAVLVDAGQKHLRERAVQLWLNKLQHLAYDIDNLLDDLATEAMRRQLNEESFANTSTSKLLKIVSKISNFTPRTILYGRKMSSKLDELTTKLRDLVEEKNILGLSSNNVERSNRASRRLEETSLVDVSRIVGREGDKEALLGKLLGNDTCSENVSIVSIVGLGGIGKTTLAKVLYNEKKVKDHFELMSWVCVSDEFDIFNISKAIYKDVGGDDQKFENLNQLQVALTEKLSKRRFLLVLDDVWNEGYTEWELLRRPFIVGAPGSKVIVTTRKTAVASMMDSVQVYPLELLSNEEALSLFAQHALGKQNFDSHPTLKSLGEGIMKKCRGLPLALIALGRVLRTKANEEEWEELLNSEIWDLQEGGNILPALKLSYYDLPPHLKQMFAYCSLFPKDYVFDKNELVLLWMAEGFLYMSDANKSMENLGRACFEELRSRSFFQHSSDDKSQYIMHDLINDLAISVAGEFFFTLDEKMNVDDDNEGLEKFHHFSFIRQSYAVYRKFKALLRARRLRTFLAVPILLETWRSFYLSDKVLIELLPQLHFLRVLSLANCVVMKVPQSIGGLKHMRYLNFSKTKITCLPEQVGDLYNLQSLLVSGCDVLSSLPDSVVKLKNLRHLDISDTPKLNKMPLGIEGLTGLQTLSKVIVGKPNGFEIPDLKGLLHLQGQLSIQGLHTVINARHAKEANLLQKKGLCDLEMEWSDVFDDSRNEITEYEVLEGLRPYHKLRSMKILYYMGIKFPSWVGDPSFVCLTQLTLRGCKNCTCLPTLGHLRSLQKLFVESMSGLKRLGSEFLGPTNSCHGIAFPSLTFPTVHDLPSAFEFLYISRSRTLDVSLLLNNFLSSLGSLSISSMPNVRSFPEGCLLQLTYLNIEGCENIESIPEKGFGFLPLLCLRYLCINDCKNLKSFPHEHLQSFTSLEVLDVFDCPSMDYSFPCGLWPPNLSKLFIGGLKKPMSVWGMQNFPTSLVTLRIYGRNSGVVSFATIEDVRRNSNNATTTSSSLLLPPSLTSLYIIDFMELESLSKCLQHLTCLKRLVIRSCPKLKDLPETLLPLLSDLWVSDCPKLIRRCLCGKKFKYWPIISQIPWYSID